MLRSDETVRVEALGKRYRIGRAQTGDDSLAHALVRGLTAPLTNFRDIRGLSRFAGAEGEDVLWALREVDFSLSRGEVLGVVGRNGAGKTTLLKILSRITQPTTGRAVIRGRVASLLEVGTGFHPDLTGRDNIFLNGTILGMSRHEVRRRFDDIVDFAEIARFVDTPVKRYSSGMYVRLAFSVAAHVEPDVLISDEVLAVGDLEFQRKCLGKMREVASGGRTVIFVSHSRASVMSLCSRALWLDGGRVRDDGETDAVMTAYSNSFAPPASADLSDRTDRSGDGTLRFERIEFRDGDGAPTPVLRAGEDAEIVLRYTAAPGAGLRSVSVAVYVDSDLGERVATLGNQFSGDELLDLPPRGEIVCRIESLPLNEGEYVCSVKARVQNVVADQVTEAGRFSVDPAWFYPTRRNPTGRSGPLLLRHRWLAAASGELHARARGEVAP